MRDTLSARWRVRGARRLQMHLARRVHAGERLPLQHPATSHPPRLPKTRMVTAQVDARRRARTTAITITTATAVSDTTVYVDAIAESRSQFAPIA